MLALNLLIARPFNGYFRHINHQVRHVSKLLVKFFLARKKRGITQALRL